MTSRALACTLCCLFTALAWPQTPGQEKISFDGVVRDAVTKAPIAKASVRLVPVEGGRPGYSATTVDAGIFRFESVAEGGYTIRVESRGYQNGSRLSVDGAMPSEGISFLRGKSVTGAIVELQPESTVTGRVTDAQGDPLPSAKVIALEEQWERGLRAFRRGITAITNDSGEYRLKLPPGRYYLKAVPISEGVEPRVYTDGAGGPEWARVPVFYPSALRFDGASPIDIAPGQELSGIAIKLKPTATYHVRGTMKMPAPVQGFEIITLEPRGAERRLAAEDLGATVEKDGAFEFQGVLPGSYSLELPGWLGRLTARVAVDVIDRDVNGIKLVSFPQFEIKGRIRLADDGFKESLQSVQFHLDLLDWEMFPINGVAAPTAEGAFSFHNRPAGTYLITLLPTRDLYIQSVLCGGRPVEGGRIDADNGPLGDIEVVVATGTGEVEGSVRRPDSKPPFPAAVILVLANGQTGNTGAMTAPVDANGHFHFRFVPPGRYLAFTDPNPNLDRWQNQDFVEQMSNRGVAVEVTGKTTATIELEMPQ